MSSSLRERFERREPAPDTDHGRSGSPAVVAIRPAAGLAEVKSIFAVRSLVARGLGLLRAKRAVEEMMERGRAVVRLPLLDDAPGLAAELAASGVRAALVGSDEIDVGALRATLSLTQEQFALRYGLDLKSLQNWESGRRRPDAAVRSYLTVIARMPERTSEALEEEVGAR